MAKALLFLSRSCSSITHPVLSLVRLSTSAAPLLAAQNSTQCKPPIHIRPLLLAPSRFQPSAAMKLAPAALLLLAFAVLLALAAAAVAPAPALVLERTLPLTGVRLVEHLKKADKARLNGRAVEFSLGRMPGLYTIRLKLGTPSKEHIFQFDTGSDLPWVSCTPCTGCPTSSDPDIKLKSYNPNSSSTSSTISCSDDRCTDAIETGYAICNTSESHTSQCDYTETYADGSATSGYYISDILYFDKVLGNERVANLSASIFFGCSKTRSDQMHTDGIIGFGQNAVSAISQLNSQGISPKVFSHCLRGSQDGGGILVLGEILKPGLVFTPLIPSQPHYNVNLKSIAVNGKNISIDSSLLTTSNAQGTMVDSGTSLAYLADGVYDLVVRAINDSIRQDLQHSVLSGSQCYFSPLSNLSLFPTMTLYFEGGAPMTVKPKDYLLLSAHYENYDVLCLAFQPSKGLENFQKITILGDIVLHDKIFVYDLEKMRIGWENYNCSLLNTTTTLIVSESSGRHAPLVYSGSMAIGIVVIIVLRLQLTS